jgi:hypothetical protein
MSDILMGHFDRFAGWLIELDQCDAKKAAFRWQPFSDDRKYAHPMGSQYGGCFLARCAFAASIHHVKSSAKRGNACSSALPPSPIGLPSTERVCAIGPAAIVDETTTMPISESVPCQAVAARAPAMRPAE